MTSARTVELVGGDGSRHTLVCSDEPYAMAPGANIWGGGMWEHDSSVVANIPGERLDNVRAGARTFAIGIVIVGSEYVQDERLGDLHRFLRSDRDVRVIYTRPSGTKREIVARCINAGNQTTLDTWKDPAAKVTLVFKAFDPYWRTVDAEIRSADFVFQDGFYALANAVEVVNDGDVNTWPRLIATGPVQNVHFTNLEVGATFRLKQVIDAGSVCRIETDPRHRNVWVNDSVNWRAVDNTLNESWPLVPGLNRLLVRGLSSPAPGPIGSFRVEWTPLYESC